MIKKVLLTAIVAIVAGGFVAGPAMASHCPSDVKKLEAAMSKLSPENQAIAKEAAANGLALHKAGKHAESVKVLHGAIEALGIKH